MECDAYGVSCRARALALRSHQATIRPEEPGSPVPPPVAEDAARGTLSRRGAGRRGCSPAERLPAYAACGMQARAAEILARIRAVPLGFVRTYDDVSPGAPRVAGAVLSSCG